MSCDLFVCERERAKAVIKINCSWILTWPLQEMTHNTQAEWSPAEKSDSNNLWIGRGGAAHRNLLGFVYSLHFTQLNEEGVNADSVTRSIILPQYNH